MPTGGTPTPLSMTQGSRPGGAVPHCLHTAGTVVGDRHATLASLHALVEAPPWTVIIMASTDAENADHEPGWDGHFQREADPFIDGIVYRSAQHAHVRVWILI